MCVLMGVLTDLTMSSDGAVITVSRDMDFNSVSIRISEAGREGYIVLTIEDFSKLMAATLQMISDVKKERV